MKNESEPLPQLQHSFTVNLQTDTAPDFDMQPDLILVSIEFLSDGVAMWQDDEPLVDPFHDNALSRAKLEYRLSYFSKHLKDILADAALKLYNESGLATEMAKGDLKDALTAQSVRKDWTRFLPKNARKRLKIPRVKSGRKRNIDERTRANFDKIYGKQLTRFKDAINRATVYKKAFPSRRRGDDWLDQWRRIAETFMPEVDRLIVEKLILEPCTASQVAYEHLSKRYKSGPTHLAKLVTQARKQRAGIRESSIL